MAIATSARRLVSNVRIITVSSVSLERYSEMASVATVLMVSINKITHACSITFRFNAKNQVFGHKAVTSVCNPFTEKYAPLVLMATPFNLVVVLRLLMAVPPDAKVVTQMETVMSAIGVNSLFRESACKLNAILSMR